MGSKIITKVSALIVPRKPLQGKGRREGRHFARPALPCPACQAFCATTVKYSLLPCISSSCHSLLLDTKSQHFPLIQYIIALDIVLETKGEARPRQTPSQHLRSIPFPATTTAIRILDLPPFVNFQTHICVHRHTFRSTDSHHVANSPTSNISRTHHLCRNCRARHTRHTRRCQVELFILGLLHVQSIL